MRTMNTSDNRGEGRGRLADPVCPGQKRKCRCGSFPWTCTGGVLEYGKAAGARSSECCLWRPRHCGKAGTQTRRKRKRGSLQAAHSPRNCEGSRSQPPNMKLSPKHAAVVLSLFILGAASVAALALNKIRKNQHRSVETAVSTMDNQNPTPIPSSVQTAVPAVAGVVTPAPTIMPANPAATASIALMALPADATAVPDEALLQLSKLVDLAHATTRPPDKQRWAQAVPVASKLMEGPCDCDQRNWLKHFVKMGNDALSNSDTDYMVEAGLLSTIRRSDTQHSSDTSKLN